MALVEPLAKQSMAPFVLMKLRGRWAIPQVCEIVLLQGYALQLYRQGFGIVLHKASAAAIRATIFLSAKSQYLQAVRAAKKLGRTTVDVPFKPQGEVHLHPSPTFLPRHSSASSRANSQISERYLLCTRKKRTTYT